MNEKKSQLIQKLNSPTLEVASGAADSLIDEYTKMQSPEYLDGAFGNQMKYNETTDGIIFLEKPSSFSGELSFVTDENMYKEISKYLKRDHLRLINSLIFEEGVMKRSNAYFATAIDMYLKSVNSEYRLATQLNLEQNLKFTEGTDNDSGLVLRDFTKGNNPKARHLFNQLEKRGLTLEDLSLWINLKGLNLDYDHYFHLTDESSYQTVECSNWILGSTFSKINDFGLPKEKDDFSKRLVWEVSQLVLSNSFLDKNSNLCLGTDVYDSGNSGRIVLAKVRGESIK